MKAGEDDEGDKKNRKMLEKVTRIMPTGLFKGNDPSSPSAYYSPMKDRQKLHTDLMGEQRYLEHCGPFEILLEGVEDFKTLHQLIGSNRDWATTHQMASKLMSPDGDIVLFTRCGGPDVLVDGRYPVRCYLDWPQGVDINDKDWRTKFHKAWVGLLAWYRELVFGYRGPFLERLNQYFRSKMEVEPGRLYRFIESVKKARAERKAAREQSQATRAANLAGGDPERNMRLIKLQDAWGEHACTSQMERKVKAAHSSVAKLTALVKTVQEKRLRVVTYDTEQLQNIARPITYRLLRESVFQLLGERKGVTDKLRDIIDLVMDTAGQWAALGLCRSERCDVAQFMLEAWQTRLPPSVYYEIVGKAVQVLEDIKAADEREGSQ